MINMLLNTVERKQSNLIQFGLVRVMLVMLLISVVSGCAGTGNSYQTRSSNNKVLKGADKALIHTQLARGYLQQKQFAVAKEELEKALRINSNHSDANYVMALLMMELEQYEVAEKHFYKAVRADRSNSSAAHDFGMFLCQIGKEQESVTYFDNAAGNPFFNKKELSYMRAGECLARINDVRAEEYLKKALAVNSKLRPALFRLAMIKHKDGSNFIARAYIERYFAITKPQPAALLLAYRIESNLNATKVADEYRVKLLEGFPASQEARFLRRK